LIDYYYSHTSPRGSADWRRRNQRVSLIKRKSEEKYDDHPSSIVSSKPHDPKSNERLENTTFKSILVHKSPL
jgi:hypothetical protein